MLIFESFEQIRNFNCLIDTSRLTFNINEMDEHDVISLLEAAEYFAIDPLIAEIDKVMDIVDPGYDINLLNHTKTGGECTITQYTYYDGASAYNEGSIEANPGDSWSCNGSFIEQTPRSHYELSHRSNTNTGSTWRTPGTGVVVIDLTRKRGQLRRLRRFLLYQMISDGYTTHVKLYYHKDLENPPVYTSNGWIPITVDWLRLGRTSEVGNPPGSDGGNSVRPVIDHVIDPVRTRFLKIECQNDGALGNPSYIEFRQIKAFSRLAGEEKKVITSFELKKYLKK